MTEELMHASTAARFLAEARLTARRRPVPEPFSPSGMRDAYDIQDRLIEHLGVRPIGWKVGATDEQSRRSLHLEEPLCGRLLHRFDSPARLDAGSFPGAAPVVECEIAFRLGMPLSKQDAPASREALRAAVDAIAPCLEVAAIHLDDLAVAGPLTLIADNAGGWSMVLGPVGPATGWDALPCAAVTLFVDGEARTAGSAATVMGDPLLAFEWLVAHLTARGMELVPGDWVCTGAMTKPWVGRSGQELRADFGRLGVVELLLR